MKRDLPAFLLYFFGFLLLWEWLRAIEPLTNTHPIEIFVVFLLIAFTLSFLKVKKIYQSMIKIFFIFFSMNRLYYKEDFFRFCWVQSFITDLFENVGLLFSINRFHDEEGFFQLSWLRSYITDVVENIGMLASRNWVDLSNGFRTLIFFIFIWIIVHLIHYWLLNRQRIFIFFFMTLVYITVLDTFTAYDAKGAIVRTVVSGFAVMGMLTFYRMIQKEKVNIDSTFIQKWMAPLAGMIALSVLIGMVAPKAGPIWPNPVPYLQAANIAQNVDGNGGTRTIGYGTDDSQLGGPFLGNDDPVFQYESNGKNYWKMETKVTYTGKGWLASGSTPIPFGQEDVVPISSFPESVETMKESARVTIHEDYQYNFIMYPAGIHKVLDIFPVDYRGNKFQVDTTNERISFYNHNNRPTVPQGITVEFEKLRYKAIDLRQTADFDPNAISPEFYQKYTQLPEGLPSRIQELAEQITAGKTNWYDKAKAIEDYFDHPEYSYDQTNVAVPGLNDDYVDQFLFDTKRGYCNNFSTSMAVMLRTLGIPTRWVKGYTGGDFIQYSDGDSEKQIYEVTNNHAHSWVEVFLPNQGWVAFEPTKGYFNELSIDYATEETATMNQPTPAVPVEQSLQEEIEDGGESEEPNSEEKSFALSSVGNDSKRFLINNWKRIVLILGIFIGVMGILYRNRGKWVPYVLLLLYRLKKRDDNNIGDAYLILLRQLERYGLKRKENQTLRNYARSIDAFFCTREMSRLTAVYEQYLYHENLPQGKWEETHKLWENLMKKTIA
jgi:transglutaminase-like putative cysteine protease